MIDEVQFLKNAFQTIKVLVEEMGKIVITSGNYKRKNIAHENRA